MTVHIRRQLPPTPRDAALARASGQFLSHFAGADRPLRVLVTDAEQEQPIELPAGAVSLLLEILEAMAAGRGVTLMPESAELTTVQAADLNVSRPFLIKLLEDGVIAYRKVGTHRRIRAEGVMAYKAAIDKERDAKLDELVAQAQEMDMGYGLWATMSRSAVLLDANVLYPAPTRDLFLPLALTDLFRARWTADIHREWIEALLRNEPGRDRARLERTRDLMDQATRDSLVTGYRSLIPSLVLPDHNDRHVLAAAIVGRCEVIVTQNLTDFPHTVLGPFGIEAQHPDEFLHALLDEAPGTFCAAVRRVRARLQNPPYSAAEYLAILTRQALVATAAELELFSELI